MGLALLHASVTTVQGQHAYVVTNGSVTNIGLRNFESSRALTNLVIPDSVISIGDFAFMGCNNLTNVIFGKNLYSIGKYAFNRCSKLTSLYFRGNAPTVGEGAFDTPGPNSRVYRLPGSMRWGPIFVGRKVLVWLPKIDLNPAFFGIRGGQFQFLISWTSGQTVTVEACTDLDAPAWSALQTRTLTADTALFTDLGWTKDSCRFYRLRSP